MPERDRYQSQRGRSPARDEGGNGTRRSPLLLRASEQAEQIYEQGMRHYHRRQWADALKNFQVVEELEPDRPGLQALLDEVQWFLQLEEVEASQREQQADAKRSEQETLSPGPNRWLWILGLLAVLLTVAALTQGQWAAWRDGAGHGRAQELYNLGQARLAVGDYVGARQVFEELHALVPDDPETLVNLERARHLEELAERYARGLEAMETGAWMLAVQELRYVHDHDHRYRDVAQLLSTAERRLELVTLLDVGEEALATGQWAAAIAALEQAQELDPTYRAGEVTDLLFLAYLEEGHRLISEAGLSVDQTREAIGQFGSALRLRPRDTEAARARRLASLYLEAQIAFLRSDWTQAISRLRALYAEEPTYAQDSLVDLLREALLAQGNILVEQGQAGAARTLFEEADALPGEDSSTVEASLLRIGASRLTPTPTPIMQAEVVVTAPILNVRSGPDVTFPILAQVSSGDRMEPEARTPNGEWLLVCCVGVGSGWVSAAYVELNVDITSIPVAEELPPTPTPTPIPSPTPTPEPTATPAEEHSAEEPTAPPAAQPPPQPAPPQPAPTPTPVPPTATPPPEPTATFTPAPTPTPTLPPR